MNKQLLHAWLRRIGLYVGHTSSRFVLLFIEMFFGRRCRFSPSINGNICVLSSPPNQTTKVHQLDAGLIVLVKTMYKHRCLLRALKSTQSLKNSSCAVKTSTATRWTKRRAANYSPTTICDCFIHCQMKNETNAKNEIARGTITSVSAIVKSTKCKCRGLIESPF